MPTRRGGAPPRRHPAREAGMSGGDWTIRTRLVLGFGLMAALLALVSGLTLVKSDRIHRGFDGVVGHQVPLLGALHRLKDEVNQVNIRARNLLLVRQPAERQAELDQIATSRAAIGATIQTLEAQIDSPEVRHALDELKTSRVAAMDVLKRFLAAQQQGQAEQALAVLNDELRPVMTGYAVVLDRLIAAQHQAMDRASEAAGQEVVSLGVWVWAIGLGSLVTALAMGAWTLRSVTRPLERALMLARAVAQGDLSQPIEAQGRSECAQLLCALHDMQLSLVRTVNGVRSHAEEVATASHQVAQGGSELSSRTEQQASALEQTAASMEQLSGTVAANAQHARDASQLALDASAVAREGGAAVEQVVHTMKGIHGSAREIAEIIGVIDGIAFQTNILALNAAVEAAQIGRAHV
jgi:methyl-accepting chemotaxis protein